MDIQQATNFVGGRKMRENERVSLLVAAKELGLAPQGLREYMKRGLIDIGVVVPSATGTSNTKRYLIYRDKLDRFIGRGGIQNVEEN